MPTDKSQAEVFQDDIHALLEVLGLGNHARTESPHQVLHQEVIPAIKRLKGAETGSSPSSPVAGSYSARWRPEPVQPGIHVADRGDWREPKAIEVLPEHLSGAYRLPEGCRWFGPIPDQARDVSDSELAQKAKRLKAEMARIAENSEECGDHGAARRLRENARELEKIERQLAA
jgi:hypothetical protein